MTSDLANATFESVLDECLVRLSRGEGLDALLGEHPDMTAELRPLLDMAAALAGAPAPRARPAAVAAGKARVLAALAGPAQASRPVQSRWQKLRARLAPRPTPAWGGPLLRVAFGILLALVVGTSGAVAASSASLPGDTLYPVKQSIERLRLTFAGSTEMREALEEHFDGQRVQEIRSLVQLRRPVAAAFEDVLYAQGADGRWTVGPFAIVVTGETVIQGQPAVGGRVHVDVRVEDDGMLTALRIAESPGHDQAPHHDQAPGPDAEVEGAGFTSPLHEGSEEHETERAVGQGTPGAVEHHDAEGEAEHAAPPASTPIKAGATAAPHHASPTTPPLQPTLAPGPAHHSEPTAQSPQPSAPAATNPPHDGGDHDGGGHEDNGGH